MTETSRVPHTATRLAAALTGLADGPHDHAGTTAAAELAAETIRYLNHGCCALSSS